MLSLRTVTTRRARSFAGAFGSLILLCAPSVLPAATRPVQASGNAASTLNYIQFSPLEAFFGNVGIGTTSQPLSVTITNGTSSVARFASFSNVSTFHVTGGTCGTINTSTTLAAGASCTFSATFSPTTSGNVVGSFTLQAGQQSATFQLKGYGINPILYFAPGSANFGNVPVGTISPAMTINVHNYTGAAATFMSATPNLSEFNFQGGTCGVPNRSQTIPANTSCSFTVEFTPSAVGPVKGSFTLSSGSGPVTFTLTGTGQ